MTGLLRSVAVAVVAAVGLAFPLHAVAQDYPIRPEVVKTLDRFEMVPNDKNAADYKKSVDEQTKLEITKARIAAPSTQRRYSQLKHAVG